jgi:hypothetical protein
MGDWVWDHTLSHPTSNYEPCISFVQVYDPNTDAKGVGGQGEDSCSLHQTITWTLSIILHNETCTLTRDPKSIQTIIANLFPTTSPISTY